MFWTTVALGVAMTALSLALSWPIARFVGDPRVQPLFAVFSVAFLIASLAATPTALLTRSMHFRALETRVIVSMVISSVVTVVLAATGYGAWAVVIGELSNRVTSLVLLWAQCAWRPSLRFSNTALRRMLGYSSSVFGAQFLIQIPLPLQNILVGRLLGAGPLGVLVLAQQIVLLPLNRIAGPIQAVMFPALSRIQDNPRRIARAWSQVNQAVGAIAFPTLGGLIVLAPEFVDVVLGAKWAAAIPVMRLLAVAGAVLALQRLNMSILQARARTKPLLWLAIASVVATAVAIVAGSPFGLNGVAASLTVQALIIQLAFMEITARAVETTLRECLSPLAGSLVATLIMAIVVAAVDHGLERAGLGAGARLIAGAVVGALVYAGSFALLCRPFIGSVREVLRSRRRQAREATNPE